MVASAKQRLRITPRECNQTKMGGILKNRKRHRSDYMKVEDDIEFLVTSKRAKLCEDGSSEDRSSPDMMEQIKDMKIESAKPSVHAQPPKVEKKKPISEEKVTEDTREVNRRSPNGFLLPDPLPRGEVLTDTIKQQWVLGKPIGVGGFGELYVAAFRSPDGNLSPEKFVIKVEPHSNGPLFVEVHFYLRGTKKEEMEKFKAERGLEHLGVPKLVANGSHVRNRQNYRFLVMDRYGSDLQRILDNSEGQRFTLKTGCSVAIQVLDSLEYIHKQGYVHKDVKGSNLLVGLGMDGQHLVHLVDFGLCSKFRIGDLHKQFRHDMRWAHEGTMEYTSRDAHIGSASRRGDLEVLFYNLIEWFGGSLPWDRELASPQVTKTAKFLAFRQMGKFLRICFRGQKFPLFLIKFMKYISGLMFEDKPDYDHLRGIILEEMRNNNCKLDGKLEFRLAKLGGEMATPDAISPDVLYGPSKRPPLERVSSVFDSACISATSYEKLREDSWTQRSQDSLENPTKAMTDIMAKMQADKQAAHITTPVGKKGRKRNKSFSDGDSTNSTPAMMEVMKIKKMKSMDDANEDLMGTPIALLKLPFKLSPVTITMEIMEEGDDCFIPPTETKKRKVSKNTELKRLENHLPDAMERRRTRSDADTTRNQRELRSNLRSAFSYGMAPVRNFMRSVSSSLPKLF